MISYNARMEVAASQVKAVYVAAVRLKMERVVNYCAQYLVDNLDPATAIEIRSLPGIQRNSELAARVDAYLAEEVACWNAASQTPLFFDSIPYRFFCIYQITSVATTKALRNLPLVQVEVLASSREEMALRDANVTILCNLVLEWIHRNWEPAQLNVDQLTAKVTRQTFFPPFC